MPIIGSLKQLFTIIWLCFLVGACGGSGGGSAGGSAGGDSANTPLTVDAGIDQTVTRLPIINVVLTATINDDDESLIISWVQTSGTPVILRTPSAASTDFYSSDVGVPNDEPLVFEVTVDDGTNTPVSDSVSVAITNILPTVDAGIDQTILRTQAPSVYLPATVTSASEERMISWVQTSGTPVTLSNASSTEATFLADEIINSEKLIFEVTVDDGVNIPVSDSVSVTVITDWILNEIGLRSTSIMELESPLGAIVNVLDVEVQTIEADDYVVVETRGVPSYTITATQELVDSLDNQPLAATAFITGSSNVEPGYELRFGSDLGYNSSNINCPIYGGFGFWPPGFDCPTETSKIAYFPASPEELATGCEIGQGVIGLWVNGVNIYGWNAHGDSDGAESWSNLAPETEQFDVDICGGHADQNEYLHHAYSSCLASEVGDDGSEHSPIYGYAADGYPLYGPYESNENLAISGWVARDYGDAISDGGCGTPGLRTCVLLDKYDLTAGVDASVTQGPNIGETVATLFDNTLSAGNGYFLEDYYFAGRVATGPQLDQHNGHNNNDGRGYHYHTTVTDDGSGKLIPAFPYTVGPHFYGTLKANALTTCPVDGS